MKKKINKRIIFLNSSITLVFLLVLFLIVFVFFYYTTSKELDKINKNTNSLIKCDQSICDIFDFVNYTKEDTSDFIIRNNGFLIEFSNKFINFNLPFNFSDINFLKKFIDVPQEYESITKEKWLLYTQEVNLNNNKYFIMIGEGLDVPWRIFKIESPEIKKILVEESKRLVNNINKEEDLRKIKSKADVIQVVREDGKIIELAWGSPAFISRDKINRVYNLGNFHLEKFKLLIIRKFADQGNFYISIKEVDLKIIFLYAFIVYAVLWMINLFFIKKFIFKIILMKEIPDISPEEAVSKGESEIVEFKSVKSLDHPNTLLKSIVSMANYKGGVIFLGIEDNGTINPLEISNIKEFDKIKEKLANIIRNSITPPPIVSFEEKFLNKEKTKVILKIKIAPFYGSLYSLNGIFYRRLGTSDIPMDFNYLEYILG